VNQVYLQSAVDERLEAVRALAAMQLPVADWEQMERESVERLAFQEFLARPRPPDPCGDVMWQPLG
jgi:hypothetical protein